MANALHQIMLISFAGIGLSACDQPQGPLRLEPGLYEHTNTIVSTGQTTELDFSLIDAASEEDQVNMKPIKSLVAIEPMEKHEVWQKCMTGHELMQVGLGYLVVATHGECELVTYTVGESDITIQNTCPASKYTSSDSQRWYISAGEARQGFEIATRHSLEYHSGDIHHTEMTHTATYLGACEEAESPPAP